ncbi:AAA-domain-containing protein [Wilcoxina mikolae CBS 423.85]|nr:AAA-domain-containing protein [Wilcoxina mikolae CBS 423.85]
MQVAIRRVLPTARQRLARPQRLGLPASTRLRLGAPARCFTHTPPFFQTPDDISRPTGASVATPGSVENSNGAIEKKEGVAGEQPKADSESAAVSNLSSEEAVNALLESSGGDVPGDRPARRGRPAGTKGGRTVTRKANVQVPKPVLPEGFIEHGVVLREEHGVSKLGIYSDPPKAAVKTESVPVETSLLADGVPETNNDNATAETVTVSPEPTKERYQLHESVWKEITAHVRTGLLLPKGAFADGLASTKSHCLLHLPKEGGVYYLDAVAEKVASEVGADLVRIDVQDFAEIAGDYLGDSRHVSRSDISPIGIRSLPYDTQATTTRNSVVYENESTESIEDPYEEDEDMVESSDGAPSLPSTLSVFNTLPTQLQQFIRSGRIAGATLVPLGGNGAAFGAPPDKEQMLDKMNERKMASLLEAMISAGHTKRTSRQSTSPPDSAAEVLKSSAGKTIVHIRDYRELERTNSGEALLKMLHNIVQDRRREGERILVLGTTSAEEDYSAYNTYGIQSLQSRSDESFERIIVVPPVFGPEQTEIFKSDRDSRIREVNIRHLKGVIRRRSGENGEAATLVVPEDWHFKPGDDTESHIPGIDSSFWNFDRVHRVATVALGELSNASREITVADIARAVRIIEESDSVKFQWAAQEQEYLKERSQSELPAEKEKAKPIPKNLTNHEKKLVSGVIDPKDIHHGFSSVRAPPETIEAMKTLTSLSLIRPEAFKYGVLATDRIPGVLLYGPPGTGKTLLARAVAKESGATVLEVSGGDIFNMYVGEGEKNVKAIFSLAKKLSPCVVFIDEADAIFGSRQSFSSRSSHREIINQFLKEWADMDSTAFIMVATNRPFDLDDAILRRLPRRILIDLPTPEDRLEILKIHLAAETLDDSVDLREIADQSSLYSGSDLKNLCVSAALTCVKEENAEFEKTGKYPEKRILAKRHFEKAASEISSSISDDMGSLGLIRKFDEKYGERAAGRKKKQSAWGFELGQTVATPKGEGRVRTD